MQAFDLDSLIAKQGSRAWLEFLRMASLSAGVYRLQAGQQDLQQPHGEDEVYYVVSGRGRFRAGTEERAVGPGTILFVERSVEHRFFDIDEELTTLVFFAPPEGSLERN